MTRRSIKDKEWRSAKDPVADSVEEEEEETSDHEKCTRLLALTAVRNAKFLSSQQKAGQFTAKSATLNIKSSNNLSRVKGWA